MATFELTKEYLETLEAAISADNKQFLAAELEELFPADISSILYELDGANAHFLFSLLDTEKGAEATVATVADLVRLSDQLRRSIAKFRVSNGAQ